MKIRRNDPCSCGSGKKYKKCCLLEQMKNRAVNDEPSMASVGADVMGEAMAFVRQQAAGQSFGSIDEARDMMVRTMRTLNQSGVGDFLGLSPKQMSELLYEPHKAFGESGSSRVMTVGTCAPTQSPILDLAEDVLEALSEGGLKLAFNGNLPNKLCKALWVKNLPPEAGPVARSEDDYDTLHMARLLLEMAGVIEVKGTRLVKTPLAEEVVAGGREALFAALFKTYMLEFNWAYCDGWVKGGESDNDFQFLQQTGLFGLYMLHQMGDESRPLDDYAEQWLRAFPQAVEMFSDLPAENAKRFISRVFQVRMVSYLFLDWGLAEVDMDGWAIEDGHMATRGQVSIKKSAAFDQLVKVLV